MAPLQLRAPVLRARPPASPTSRSAARLPLSLRILFEVLAAVASRLQTVRQSLLDALHLSFE